MDSANTNKIPLIVVEGATASGKSALALRLAEELGGEIISADSMQIYKYMDIGTAKPTAAERKRCRHHLIDFLEPDAPFSVADYAALAHETAADIFARGKLPILCGGTGLYIDSVVNNVDFGAGRPNPQLRAELAEIAEKEGGVRLLEMLREFDPTSAEKIHPNNVKRLIRAIELYKETGHTLSQQYALPKESRYTAVKFIIHHERGELYDRINRRVDAMLEAGLEDEVKRLAGMGYTRDLNSMQGIGYKEMFDYFDGRCNFDTAVDTIKQSSRRYAKRQMTWFRRDRAAHTLSGTDAFSAAMKIIADWRAGK